MRLKSRKKKSRRESEKRKRNGKQVEDYKHAGRFKEKLSDEIGIL